MSMRSELATENYLKAIVKALAEPGKERVGTGELARLLKVTSGTATVMLKKLERLGFLEYEPHRGCALTESGRAYGLRVLRRHRILETFLVRVLGLDWSAVHDEAENLEHAASEKLIDAIDAFLGQPARDPNGDPIPAKAQREYRLDDIPLIESAAGETVRVSRIAGGQSRWAYYRREGLIPGARLRVIRVEPEAGLMTLSFEGKETAFALSALSGVYIERRS
jgi:DtxR family Mn-dependent transcriptional regulator